MTGTHIPSMKRCKCSTHSAVGLEVAGTLPHVCGRPEEKQWTHAFKKSHASVLRARMLVAALHAQILPSSYLLHCYQPIDSGVPAPKQCPPCCLAPCLEPLAAVTMGVETASTPQPLKMIVAQQALLSSVYTNNSPLSSAACTLI